MRCNRPPEGFRTSLGQVLWHPKVGESSTIKGKDIPTVLSKASEVDAQDSEPQPRLHQNSCLLTVYQIPLNTSV